MRVFAAITLLTTLALSQGIASAADEAAEYWFNPSVSLQIDSDTGAELETAQRLRAESDGRADTHFGRLWLHQSVGENTTLSGALERRINQGASQETRVIQQLSSSHGVLRTRLRFEQRFVDNADRTGLRLRPRLGLVLPLDADQRLEFKMDAEPFFTLRSSSNGGETGLSALRTQIGFAYEVNARLSLSAAYLRQQDISDRRTDTVAHAPLIGLELSL